MEHLKGKPANEPITPGWQLVFPDGKMRAVVTYVSMYKTESLSDMPGAFLH